MAPNDSSEPPAARKNSLSAADDHADDDWLSLLSEYRAEEFRGGDEDGAAWSFACSEDEFQAEWDWLEEQLAARWARLDKICQDIGTNNKPNSLLALYVKQMRRRELEVAQLKRDELLQYYARSSADSDNKNRKQKTDAAGRNTTHTKPGAGTSNPLSCFRYIWESFIFEMNSTLPAIFSLLFYNIFMISVFDLVDAFWGVLRGQSSIIESSFSCVAMLVGGMLLYSTGDLGWWLNDRDHDRLKFDLHNRVRLPGWHGARLIHAVRYYLPVRWLVFLFGYNCCYQAAQHLFELGEVVWNQSESMLRNLPSNTFDVNLFQTLDEAVEDETHIASIFLCARTCQDEIDRREAASAEILRADQEYTERVLAASSHSSYWFKWALRHTEHWYFRGRPEAPPVFDSTGDLLYYFVVVVSCILILRWYGFAFWERY